MLFMGDGGSGRWGGISEENSCQNASDIQKIGALGMGVMGDRCSHFVKSKTVSPKVTSGKERERERESDRQRLLRGQVSFRERSGMKATCVIAQSVYFQWQT